MSLISQWLGSEHALADFLNQDRAYDTARVIAAKSASIEVIRGGSKEDAQTVRIEVLSSGALTNVFDRMGMNVSIGVMGILVIGYKSHPTISDTDLQRADRFKYLDEMYEVQLVINNIPDRLLAVAEVTAR
jgi:hypothetical protein